MCVWVGGGHSIGGRVFVWSSMGVLLLCEEIRTVRMYVVYLHTCTYLGKTFTHSHTSSPFPWPLLQQGYAALAELQRPPLAHGGNRSEHVVGRFKGLLATQPCKESLGRLMTYVRVHPKSFTSNLPNPHRHQGTLHALMPKNALRSETPLMGEEWAPM